MWAFEQGYAWSKESVKSLCEKVTKDNVSFIFLKWVFTNDDVWERMDNVDDKDSYRKECLYSVIRQGGKKVKTWFEDEKQKDCFAFLNSHCHQ